MGHGEPVRMLLTSAGLTNAALSNELIGLLGTDPRAARLAFVPTAANVEDGDKGWLIDELVNLRAVGFAEVDLVDISALPREQWQRRLEAADVIAISGGNTAHLLAELRRTGAADVLLQLLTERVYLGSSAGSIVTGREAILAVSRAVFGEETDQCLAYLDLVVVPHLNSPMFPNAREDRLRELADEYINVYAFDDDSALRVIGDDVTAVGGGQVMHLNALPTAPARLSS